MNRRHWLGKVRAYCPTLGTVRRSVALVLVVNSLRADAAIDDALTAAKTHTLFMGADIAVRQSKDFYRVKDVSGGSFVIDVKGSPVFVPMTGQLVTLRVDAALKVTRVSASLSNLAGERAYTTGNNPRIRNAMEQARLTMVLSAARAELQARYNTTALDSADQAFAGIADGGTYFSWHLQEDLAKEAFDAMAVNFDVTSETPLDHPYVVIITRYHEAGADPGAVRNWIFAKSLNPIFNKPEKVHLLQGGFPPGFEIENFQVHLYNQGQEVATNLAPKRVPLTANEAMLYLMIDYLASHRNDDVAASPAMATLPADFQARLAHGEGGEPLFIRVSKDGRAREVFVDPECTRKLEDPYFAAAVRAVRFKPALEKGKPVEGITRLKLTDLLAVD